MSDYYNNYVKGANDVAGKLAEQIRTGSAPKADTSAPEGLMRMRKKIQEDTTVVKEDSREMMLRYLNGIKTPSEAAVEDTPTTKSQGNLADVTNPVVAAREAIAAVESRGSGDYKAVGEVIKNPKSMYYGDRAYGRYQVMGNNIGPWTKKVFGREMSKEEFLNSEAAQDAVVEWKLSQEYKKHGSWEDAASVWFSGNPYTPDNKASDGSTTVPEYITKFRTAWNSIADNLLGDAQSFDLSPTAEAEDQRGIMNRRTK